MKPIRLKIKTKSENYPVFIGSDIIKNLDKFLNQNSIKYNKCLL